MEHLVICKKVLLKGIVPILTLKQRTQFLQHYININARPIYGDTVL